MDDLFVGSAVSTINARGELLLPEHFCVTIQSRGARDDLFIALHADDPCMLVYDRHNVVDQHRHLAGVVGNDDDSVGNGGLASGTRDMLLRRRLGFVAPAQMDGKGRLRIASWMRSRRGVRQRALLVGMGRHFEVWNLDAVLEQGPGDLIVLAALHLDSLKSDPKLDQDPGSPTIKEDHHEPALSRLGARRRAARPGKSGVPVQPLPALSPRPDPLRPTGSRSSEADSWTCVPEGLRVAWRSADVSAFDRPSWLQSAWQRTRERGRRVRERGQKSTVAVTDAAQVALAIVGWHATDAARRARETTLAAYRSGRRVIRLPRPQRPPHAGIVIINLTMDRDPSWRDLTPADTQFGDVVSA